MGKKKKSKAGLAFTGALVVGGGCPGPVLSLGEFPGRPRDRLDPAAGSSPGWKGDQTRRQSRWMEGRVQQSFPGRPESETLLPGRNPKGRKTGWGDNHHALAEARKKVSACLKGFADTSGKER